MCIKRVFYTVTSLYPKPKTVDFIGGCIFYSLDGCTKFNLHIYGRKFCSKDIYVDYIIGNSFICTKYGIRSHLFLSLQRRLNTVSSIFYLAYEPEHFYPTFD